MSPRARFLTALAGLAGATGLLARRRAAEAPDVPETPAWPAPAASRPPAPPPGSAGPAPPARAAAPPPGSADALPAASAPPPPADAPPPRRHRGIAPLGAVSASGEERPGRPGWAVFALLLLLALLIALGAVALLDTDTTDERADEPPVAAQTQAAPSLPHDAGTLQIGDATVTTGARLDRYLGEPATGSGLVVQQVDGKSGFFVGGGPGRRTFVEWGPRAGGDESQVMPNVGDRVDLGGPVADPPRQPGRTFGIPVASEQVILRQRGYINADTVTPAR